MSTRGTVRKRATVAGVVFLLVLLGIVWLWPREPVYQGRSLSSWLQDMDGYAGPKMARAQEAVRAMDTNAVPHLVKVLRARDSGIAERITRVAQKTVPSWKLHTPLIERHRQAIYACQPLGTNGRAALPHMAALLYLPKYDVLAHPISAIMAEMGPDVIPFFKEALTSTNTWVRANVAGNAAKTKDSALAPFLLRCLDDPDSNVKIGALQCYWQLEPDTTKAVQSIVRALDDPDPRVQSSAAYWFRIDKLGKHPSAKAAVPALTKLLESMDPALKNNASIALAQINTPAP